MKVNILTESDIRKCVSLDEEAIRAVEDGFTSLANGEAVVPPVVGVEIPERRGELDVKTAYIKGLDSFAIKIAAGFFENERLGVPVASGMMVIVSAETGHPQALLLDNGYLTQVRTGAAGAIAAKYLAREPVDTVGIIGAGVQGRYQAIGLSQVREFRHLRVYDVSSSKVDSYVEEMGPLLGVHVSGGRSAEEVVRASDIVVTTTPSREPIVRAEWLHPGLHITAMGADGPEKQELAVEVLRDANRLACDRREQCFVRGELHHALAAGILSMDAPITELGELTSGRKAGRQSDRDITVCDLTGVGVQDTAIALLAYDIARREGLGMEIEA